MNLRRNAERSEPNQKAVSSIITRNNLREKLIQRTFSQHANLKGLFDEWRLPTDNYVSLARFQDLMNLWGFIASDEQVQEVFDWLDYDKDG